MIRWHCSISPPNVEQKLQNFPSYPFSMSMVSSLSRTRFCRACIARECVTYYTLNSINKYKWIYQSIRHELRGVRLSPHGTGYQSSANRVPLLLGPTTNKHGTEHQGWDSASHGIRIALWSSPERAQSRGRTTRHKARVAARAGGGYTSVLNNTGEYIRDRDGTLIQGSATTLNFLRTSAVKD